MVGGGRIELSTPAFVSVRVAKSYRTAQIRAARFYGLFTRASRQAGNRLHRLAPCRSEADP